jgi:hypothetical protein
MATTYIKAVHRTNSGSIAAAIKRTIEYTENADKTKGGELLAAYQCDPRTAVSEFMLAKQIYANRTGRNQGKNDVIGYHMRQSFKPGEVTAEEALKIGYDLAMRWTKGKHQFVVAAHTNTNNPHTHIIFNSVNLDCTGKYADFKRSAIALRRLSDQICLENGLSIIKKPGLSHGYNYAKQPGVTKPKTGREKLCELIDQSLSVGMSLTEFFTRLKQAGCEIKAGKQVSIKPLGSKKFFRLDTLGDDYSHDAIMERLVGKWTIETKGVPSLLIDIQAKIAEGKGKGYKHWAQVFNVKQMAKTLLFLQEQGIENYKSLVEKSSKATANVQSLNKQIRSIENQQKAISELQRQIGVFIKTRKVYEAYKTSKWSQKFYDAHTAEIVSHRAAKTYFNAQGFKGTLPSITSLKQEWATLDSEKRGLYKEYHSSKEIAKELSVAWQNAEEMLFGKSEQRTQQRALSFDR